MLPDCGFSYPERGCDLDVLPSLGDELQDLPLSGGESLHSVVEPMLTEEQSHGLGELDHEPALRGFEPERFVRRRVDPVPENVRERALE